MQVETDSVSRVQNKNAKQIKIFIKLLILIEFLVSLQSNSAKNPTLQIEQFI